MIHPAMNPKTGAYNQFAQRVSRGHLCARPAELLDHEVVIERESPKRETDDAEQDDEGGDGYLGRARLGR